MNRKRQGREPLLYALSPQVLGQNRFRLFSITDGKAYPADISGSEKNEQNKVRQTIEDAIHLHDKLILILSQTSIESDWVEHEVNHALKREKRESSLLSYPNRRRRNGCRLWLS